MQDTTAAMRSAVREMPKRRARPEQTPAMTLLLVSRAKRAGEVMPYTVRR